MSLTPFAPINDLVSFSNRLNRFMEDFWPAEDGRMPAARAWRPAVDVWEDERSVTVTLDLPGVRQESIDVQITGDTLTITGERLFERQEGVNYLYLERRHGRFSRSFTLGVPVEAEQVTARYHEGVLTVLLPKKDEVRPRKIAVTPAEAGA